MGNFNGGSPGPDLWAVQNLVERLIGGICDYAGRLSAFVEERRRQTHLERQLRGLEDGDLADMGIERHQITDIARSRAAPELLRQMLAALKIEEVAFTRHPGLRAELAQRCRACEMRRECRRWLRNGEPAEGYRHFCWNAPALIELAAQR